MAATIDLQTLLPEQLIRVSPDGLLDKVAKQEVAGKTILLYFSAHWCPPCRGFTPHLASIYAALKKKDTPMELVFISHDKDAASFESYFKEMAHLGGGWLSLPFKGSEGIRSELASLCGVSGIPTLTVIGPDGSVVAPNARQAVSQDDTGERFPWTGAAASSGGMSVWFMLALFLFMVVLPRVMEYLKG